MPLDKQLRGNIISDNNGVLEVGFLERTFGCGLRRLV